MKPVIADTSYFLALVNTGDVSHSAASLFSREARRAIMVTEFLLVELGNALSRGYAREVFVNLVRHLRSDANVTIIPASQELLDRGFELFANRPDKTWSLTDCISFVVMQEHGVTEALSTDRHFRQAGFTVLLEQD